MSKGRVTDQLTDFLLASLASLPCHPQAAVSHEYELSDPVLNSIIDADLLEQLHEDLELLEVRAHAHRHTHTHT